MAGSLIESASVGAPLAFSDQILRTSPRAPFRGAAPQVPVYAHGPCTQRSELNRSGTLFPPASTSNAAPGGGSVPSAPPLPSSLPPPHASSRARAPANHVRVSGYLITASSPGDRAGPSRLHPPPRRTGPSGASSSRRRAA